jgi:hypothetical protein
MRCVVCGAAVGRPSYANAWERSRKMFPCCTDACATSYDPDQHWIPATPPERASDDDIRRLDAVLRQRIRAGDVPVVVVREMLVAGVPSRTVRGALVEHLGAGIAAEVAERNHTIANVVRGLLTGRVRIRRSPDKRDPTAIQAGIAEIERWDASPAGAGPR